MVHQLNTKPHFNIFQKNFIKKQDTKINIVVLYLKSGNQKLWEMKNKKKRQQKILLVDDEPNILIALTFLFEKEGYLVENAVDGKDAIEKTLVFLPDVIVLDVMMPHLNGFEVAKQIRQIPSMDNTPIFFLSAKGSYDDKMKGYESGGEYYITKPFDNDHLLRLVNELVIV